jgi:hypothetical protein
MVRTKWALCVFVAILIGLSMIWATARVFLVRRQVRAAMQLARSVRLEEFRGDGAILTKIVLPQDKWSEVLRAVPVVPDIGTPGVALCFVPHHRIVITTDGTNEFRLNICFACQQASTQSSGIFGVPYLWRSSLRHIFVDHQVPIRDEREYVPPP